MSTIESVKQTLAEILDIEEDEIKSETYIIRELGAESIDLLELGVMLSANFKVDVDDDEIFLGSLRLYLNEAMEKNIDPVIFVSERLAHLSSNRVREIMNDLNEGPVLKLKDIVSYIDFKMKNN